MKKIHWLLLAFFALAANALRILNLQTGFEANGLPVRGNFYAVLLPALLLTAAAVFAFLFRVLPAQRDETKDMAHCFDFSGTLSVMLAVLGAFTLIGSSVLSILFSYRKTQAIVLGAALTLSAAVLLYVVFVLRREENPMGAVLALPVCALVLKLILTYRACANDPVLGHTYIQILSVCALVLVLLEFAAFAFRNGTPRFFLPLCAMAVILCVCRIAESSSLPTLLFNVSFLFIVLSFCTAADFADADAK